MTDWSPLLLSLRVSVVATLIAAVIGVAIAYALAEGRFRGRGLLEGIAALPLILPPTVLGYALLVALGRQTAVGRAIEHLTGSPLVFTWQGAVVAALIPAVPYVVRTARAAFASVDQAVREAARIDGASRLQLLLFVLLPLARGGVAAGLALAFARSLGEFGATLMFAGGIPGRTETMAIAVYNAVQAGRIGDAGVLAAILATAAVAVLLVVRRLGDEGA